MSELYKLLSSAKFYFWGWWLFLMVLFWIAGQFKLSDFPVLIPYAIISAILAGLITLRAWVFGQIEDDDDDN